MLNTLLNDRYRIEAEVGRGGMGVVYRAWDTLLDRNVAVKLLHSSNLGTEGRARLLHEAQAAARLNHPNIITIYDAGELEGASYIIMELLDGESLYDRRPQTLPEILKVARQICTALEHAHAHGIIHRDLKPENVIITRDGTAKLTDFGLARSMASRITIEGTIMGTVYYLPPEQALGKAIDGRADLYSFGVMLYELVTSQLPFNADDPLAVISQHLHAPPVPPRSYNNNIPPLLDRLIMQLLQKNPEDRPASAAETKQILAQVLRAPIAAAANGEVKLPPSPLEQLALGRLVGRDRELAEAKALWKQATLTPGGQHVLFISGEPGVGKTPLMREIKALAEVSGAIVLEAECYTGGSAPYAPVTQMMRAALAQRSTRAPAGKSAAALPSFSNHVLADLIMLAPDLQIFYPDVPPNPSYDARSDQQRLFESITTVCAALVECAPLMLVMEDVHWADSGSLDVARYVARRCRLNKLPVLIVMTYRDVELDAACCLDDILYDLTRERLAFRLKLNRFDREQTRALLDVMFQEKISDEFLDAIYRETDGNQFFVEELCKALVADGQLYRRDGRWQRPNMGELQLPQSVRGAIQARVGRLPDAAQEALRWAAVIGREFDFGTLKWASEMEEETLIDALEMAERAQLISELKPDRYARVRAGAETFAFAHALTVTALRESMSAIRRRRLHRQVANALAQQYPDNYEALAYHYAEAGDIENARRYYLKAGDRALAVYTNQEAERHYRTALELSESEGDEAELRGRLGEALFNQNRYGDAIAVWLQAITVYRAQAAHDQVARLYARAGRAAWYNGETPRGLALCREGMAAVPAETETPGLAVLLHETGRACFFNGLPDEALMFCQQAMTLAKKLKLIDVQADTLATIGILPKQTPEARIAALQKAVTLAESAGLLAIAVRAHVNLSGQLKHSLNLVQSRFHSARALELTHRTGAVLWKLDERMTVFNDALTAGDIETGEQLLDELRELIPTMPIPAHVMPQVDMMAAWHDYQRGRYDTAIELLQQCQADFRRLGDLQQLSNLNCDLGMFLRELNRLQEAEAVLLEAIEIGDRGLGSGPVVPRCELAVVYVCQGRHAEAQALLEQARQLINQDQAYHEQARLNLSEALIAVQEQRWSEAIAHFAEVAVATEQLDARWYQARVRLQWAEAHLARGEAADYQLAYDLLQQCHALFTAMKNSFYLAKVEEKLAKMPAIPSGAAV